MAAAPQNNQQAPAQPQYQQAPVQQAPAQYQQTLDQQVPFQQQGQFQQQSAGFAAPAPAKHHAFAGAGVNLKNSLTSATGFGKRSLAMLGGSVAAFICMFQPWISMPWVDKALAYAANQVGTDNYGLNQVALTSAQSLVRSSFDMPHVFSLSGALRSLGTGLNNMAMQITHYSSSTAAQCQTAAGSVGLVANILTIFSVLWLACLVAIVAGVVIKFVKKQDVVLFAGLGATAFISLVCIIGALVANGQVDGAITQMLASNGGSDAFAAVTAVKPFLAPAFGAILTFIFSVAGLVSAFALKEE